MTVSIWLSDKLKSALRDKYFEFLQQMANRRMLGALRYEDGGNGQPERRQHYLTRLKLEVKAYSKSGNREHLLNIANYCWLESVAPEHPRHHHDGGVDSATRGKV